MGHVFNYEVFNEKTKKEVMYAWSVEFCEMNCDRGENPDGTYDNYWKQYSEILESQDKAEEFLDSKGMYNDGCVRFKEHVEPKETARLKTLKEREDKAWKEYYEFKNKNQLKDIVKTNFVTCKCCKSKINTEKYKENDCPVCESDLRPISIQNKQEKLRTKYYELREQRLEEYKKQKAKTKTETKWLVKTEVHC